MNRPALESLPMLNITSHAAGAVFYRLKEENRVEFLSFKYTRGKETTWRLPLGKGEAGETLRNTLERELKHEVAEDGTDFAFMWISPQPVYWEVVPDDNEKNERHLKAFYLVELKRGKCRTFVTVEEVPGKLNEVLDCPQWIEASRLIALMNECGKRAHRKAVIAALSFLSKDKAIAKRYGGVFRRQIDVMAASVEETEAVGLYLASFS